MSELSIVNTLYYIQFNQFPIIFRQFFDQFTGEKNPSFV